MSTTESSPPFRIGIPVYDQVDLLDIAAPREMFSWMSYYWQQAPTAPRSATVQLIAATDAQLRTRDGLAIIPDATFADFADQYLDLLWVPGGDPDGLQATMGDPVYLGFLQQQSAHVRYVSSVCEGALLLASAGLLDGYRATTHWAFIPCLQSNPAITVAPGYPRFVHDRNRVTGGGISAGLDEALELIRLIAGPAIARQVQQVTQYFPLSYKADIPDPTGCPVSVPWVKGAGASGG